MTVSHPGRPLPAPPDWFDVLAGVGWGVALASADRQTIVMANRAFAEMLGYTQDELAGKRILDVHPTGEHRRAGAQMLVIHERGHHAFETTYLRADGTTLPVLVDATAITDDDGNVRFRVIHAHDLSDARRAEASLRERERQLAEAQRIAKIGSFEWDLAEDRVTWSDELARICGVEPPFPAAPVDAFLARVHHHDRATVLKTIEATMAHPGPFRVRMRIVRPGGEIRHLSCWGEVVPGDDGEPVRLVGICQDVTEERLRRRALEESRTAAREAGEKLAFAATHDSLTGLANRSLVLDRIELSVARAQRESRLLAAMLIDLDRFVVVNNSLGHVMGDQVLRMLADRLRRLVRPGDTLARFGSDELLLLCEGVSDEHEVMRLAGEAIEAVHAPLAVAGRRLELSASIGVALAGDGPGAAATLLRDIQTAMRRAQEEGGGRVAIFDAGMGERAHARLEAEQDLRHVLSNGGLTVAYQPVVRLADRAVVGLEALARMHVPGKGPQSPTTFIPLAEEIGLIDKVGRGVLTRSCREAVGFSGPAGPLQLAVNVSATELARPHLAGDVAAVLDRCGLEPGRLCLEVTETALMAHPGECATTLRAIKALGVSVAIDDFGTGHSSLAYLRSFPVDVLKVDRSFIAELGTTPTDDTLVSGIVSLAHGLGHDVIAEGVETADQLEYLSIVGADLAQGFYFSPPVPAEELPGTLAGLGASWRAR